MDGSLGALESLPCAISPLNGPANTRDLAWPHKISDFKTGRAGTRIFPGRDQAKISADLALPETKYRKSRVEQAALTRPVLAKSLWPGIRGTAWWARQGSNL
jgi:hypothetical protein